MLCRVSLGVYALLCGTVSGMERQTMRRELQVGSVGTSSAGVTGGCVEGSCSERVTRVEDVPAALP